MRFGGHSAGESGSMPWGVCAATSSCVWYSYRRLCYNERVTPGVAAFHSGTGTNCC
jgi:hypothetical protein